MKRIFAASPVILSLLLGAPSALAEEIAEGAVRVGVVDVFPTGPSVEERLAELRRRIQAAVLYPHLARLRGLEGVARVGFEIGPRGHAAGVELLESSGHPSLDRAARRSVVDAGALPRVYGRLVVPVRFELGRRR